MNNKNLIITLFLIIVPLVLLILWYRNYVYTYCQNDMKCLKEKLIFNLDNINNKLQIESFKIQKKIEEEEKKEIKKNIKNSIQEEKVVEGFFSGLSSWFSGSSPSNLSASPGTLPNESLSLLEKKISDTTIKSNKFPPEELNGTNDDFKDADNTDLLNSVQNKNKNNNNKNNNKSIVKPNNDNKDNNAVFSKNNFNEIIPPASNNKMKTETNQKVLKKTDNKESKENPKLESNNQLEKKSIFGSCQFFNDKCPDNYSALGNFSIQGVSSNSILTCGNVQNTRPARAVAEIKNNSVYEIHITDQGHGFNPSSSPKVSIEGGKGHGATAEAVVDDDGFLKLIKVINPGYNYTETPNVIIDAPFMNSSCHLCCKNE